jgi:hypothetical protein
MSDESSQHSSLSGSGGESPSGVVVADSASKAASSSRSKTYPISVGRKESKALEDAQKSTLTTMQTYRTKHKDWTAGGRKDPSPSMVSDLVTHAEGLIPTHVGSGSKQKKVNMSKEQRESLTMEIANAHYSTQYWKECYKKTEALRERTKTQLDKYKDSATALDASLKNTQNLRNNFNRMKDEAANLASAAKLALLLRAAIAYVVHAQFHKLVYNQIGLGMAAVPLHANTKSVKKAKDSFGVRCPVAKLFFKRFFALLSEHPSQSKAANSFAQESKDFRSLFQTTPNNEHPLDTKENRKLLWFGSDALPDSVACVIVAKHNSHRSDVASSCIRPAIGKPISMHPLPAQ